jgi:hypothetical protein
MNKVIEAKATFMTLQEYATFRGWQLPADLNGDEEGHFVEYVDTSGQHYKAWLPKPLFDKMNRPSQNNLTFGQAIEAAKAGYRVSRRGWNGKDMFVVYMPLLKLPPHSSQEPGAKVNDRTAKYIGKDTPLNCQPYFAMFNAQKEWIPGWLASQSDMLSEDWFIYEG